MHLHSSYLLALLILGSITPTVEAIKCSCRGGLRRSRDACEQIGGVYEKTACGFEGCCVTAGNTQESFIQTCRSLGYGFKRCDDCDDCPSVQDEPI